MNKKSLFFLCLLLCLFSFSGNLIAAETWDGTTVDTSWYNAEEFDYTIASAAQLAGLANLVNNCVDDFAGKTVALTADIDLGGVKSLDGKWSGKSWVSIGSSNSTPFAGTFDGKGHSVSNLYIESQSNYQGLFGRVSGKIRNLNLSSGCVYVNGNNREYVGGIVGSCAVILNCFNGADVATDKTNSNYVGGIVGSASGYIMNCYNAGNVTGGNNVGGICGDSSGYLINCYNTGSILSTDTGNYKMAAGIANGGKVFASCYNIGKVSGASDTCNLGGISSSVENSIYDNCYSLKTDAVGATVSGDVEGAVSKSETEMKSIASVLGTGYVEDSENINQGYPILKWQKKVDGQYCYDPDETEGMDILADSITDVTDSGFKVKMDRLLVYSKLCADDFSVVAVYPEGEEEVSNLAVAVSADESNTIVTFSFGKLNAEITAYYKVRYHRGTVYSSTSVTTGASELWQDYAARAYASGDGSSEAPYKIETAAQLARFGKLSAEDNHYYANTFFEISADIDLSGKTWASAQFNGFLDGKNHQIKGLNATNGGLFNCLNCELYNGLVSGTPTGYVAVVENLHFVEPSAFMSVLAKNAMDVRISNCTVTGGTVSGATVGSLVGSLYSLNPDVITAVERCSSTASVSGYNAVGGLVGTIAGKKSSGVKNPVYITDCWTGGTASAYTYSFFKSCIVGGIIGTVSNYAYGVTMENCFSTTEICGDGKTLGGLVGYVNTTKTGISGAVAIYNSGALNSGISSTNTGAVAGRIVSGGATMVSSGKGTLDNNYGLDIMSVMGGYVAEDENTNGSGVSKEQTMLQSFWESTLRFDFTDGVWSWSEQAMENGYPILQKEPLSDSSRLYLSSEPCDATAYNSVLNPANAVFAVIAEGGASGYKYQWEYCSAGQSKWTEIKEANKDTLSVGKDDSYKDGTKFRCVVTDQAGQKVTSEAALLTVTSAKYKAEDALREIRSYYEGKGEISRAREAFSIATVNKNLTITTVDENDEEVITPYQINTPYWTTYSGRYTDLDIANGGFPFAMMDSYVQGIDPARYEMTGDGSVIVLNLFNLFSRYCFRLGNVL